MSAVTRWSWTAIAGLAAVLAVVAWVAWPGPVQEQPRAREFRDYDVCLLAGPALPKPVWEQLGRVQERTKVRISYLSAPTAEQAPVILASLVQQQCLIIVAAGQAQVDAATAAAADYPDVRFVLVDGSGGAANVSHVDIAGLADHVSALVPRSQ